MGSPKPLTPEERAYMGGDYADTLEARDYPGTAEMLRRYEATVRDLEQRLATTTEALRDLCDLFEYGPTSCVEMAAEGNMPARGYCRACAALAQLAGGPDAG